MRMPAATFPREHTPLQPHELEALKIRYRLTGFGGSGVFRRLNRRQYQTATRCLSLIFVH